MPGGKPNILLITADQLRRDALGCCGNRAIRTPNLDRLASEGVNFKNSYTPSPICVPARASITTGLYPHKCTGTKANSGSIRKGCPLLGEELNRRGYSTYAMGKLHYLPYMPPGAKRTTYGISTVELAESGRILKQYDPGGGMRGLEDYHDYLHTAGWGGYERAHGLGNNDIFPSPSPVPREHYVDSWVADRAVHYMGAHLDTEPRKPFFMWASFPKPHSAFDPPRPFDAIYDPREIPPPAGDIGMLKERGLFYLASREEAYMWKTFSPESRKVIKAYYFGLVTHQDEQVGKLLQFLRGRGVEDDTVVIFTADHGEMLGDFGIYFKSCFYSGSSGIPLIVRFPGVFEGGLEPEQPAGLQDILPTIAQLSGSPLESDADGEDLAGLASGLARREYYVSQCWPAPQQQYMVAGRRWKYIYHERGAVEELYDLDEDPCEINNLAGSAAGEAGKAGEDMRDYLIEWCKDNADDMMLDGEGLAESEAGLPGRRSGTAPSFGRRFY